MVRNFCVQENVLAVPAMVLEKIADLYRRQQSIGISSLFSSGSLTGSGTFSALQKPHLHTAKCMLYSSSKLM